MEKSYEMSFVHFTRLLYKVLRSENSEENSEDSRLFTGANLVLRLASSRVATSLDLDLAFVAVDVNDDLACILLLSPLSPSPLPSPLLLLLLLLGSPSKIHEFSLS